MQWQGFFLKAGTPPAVKAKIVKALGVVVHSPEFKAYLKKSPGVVEDFITDESALNKDLDKNLKSTRDVHEGERVDLMDAGPGWLRHLRLSYATAEAATAFAVLLGSFYLLKLTFQFTHATKAGYAGAALFPQIALGLLILCSGKMLAERLLERWRGRADRRLKSTSTSPASSPWW